MLKSFEGVYRHGKVELDEVPDDLADETRVIVTVLEPGIVDLRAHGIDAAEAAELRGALSTFAEDWDDEAMAAYDPAK
jgi:hypothetical protein